MTSPQVFIDVGDATAVDPLPTGQWDAARWDDPGARWSGTMPNWREVSCRVRHVRIDGGRDGALDVFTPATALVEVANNDGWATWSPAAPGPITDGAWLRVRVDAQPIFTGTVRRVTDRYSPGMRPGADIVATDALARLGDVDVEDLPEPRGGGDSAAERIGWLLDYAGWPPEARSLDPGGVELAAFRTGGNLVDLAQRAAVTAGGALFADRAGVICYRGPAWLRTDPRSTAPVARVSNTPTPPPGPPNLLTAEQADMETGSTTPSPATSGWQAYFGHEKLARVTPGAAGGSGLAVSYTAANWVAACPRSGTTPQRFPVTPGVAYTFMASVKPPTINQVTLQVDFRNAAGAIVTQATARFSNLAAGVFHACRAVFTAPAGAATATPITAMPLTGAGAYVQDRAGWFVGDVATWTPPPTGPPVPQLCAIAMAPSGPDTEWVYNVATVAGLDESTDPAVTAEVRRVDQASWQRYGPAGWPITGLYSVDPDQLGILAARVLGLRAKPRPRLDTLDLSPVADAGSGPLMGAVRYGDRIHTDYTDREGWGWAFRSHVHGIAHDIAPSGVENRAAQWTCALTLDDADYWEPGPAWDYGIWDTDRWGSAPAREGVLAWA